MADDSSKLQTKIYTALTSGSSVTFDFCEFDTSSGAKVVPQNVSFKDFSPTGGTPASTYPSIKSVLSASSLIDGTSLTDLIPVNSSYVSVVLDEICLMDVNFTLYTQSKGIGSFTCILGLGSDGQGVSWSPFSETGHFSATLNSISIGVINPFQKGAQSLLASIAGEMDIGSKGKFDVSLSFPEIELEVSQVPNTYCSISDLLAALDIKTGSGNDFFDSLLALSIENFYLQANVSEQSASIGADIVELDGDYSQPVPIVLIKDLLALDQLSLNFSYQPGNTKAGIVAAMEFLNGTNTALKFNIGASYEHTDQGDTFTVSGNIDVGGTLAAWQAQGADVGTISGDSKLILSDLCQQMFGFKLPVALEGLYISAMSASYSTTSAAGSGTSSTTSSAYTFFGVVGGDWQVSGFEIKAQIQISLSNTENSILCDFDFKGFAFELGYSFNKKVGTVAIPELEGLTGSYAFPEELATINFGSTINIEALVEWFVGSVTGNPGFEFGAPWNKVFDEVSSHLGTVENRNVLDSSGKGISFTISLKQGNRYVEVYLPVASLSLPFDITISAITIKYKEGIGSGKGTLNLGVEGKFPFLIMADGSSADPNSLSWDPSQPGTEPTVSGLGSSFLDIQVVALGQRVSYPLPAPESVEDAINDLIVALQPEEGSDVNPIFPNGLEFNPDSSWLIGNRIVLLGQMVVELIFNDPQMYGAMIRIDAVKPPSTGNAKLNTFAGLYFEIMYRKLTDNIGEYYVALTLPEQFRTINLGSIVIHLPSLSLAVYTNGNFKIDIGFPYKADFSKSFGATYLVFTGLGGFYFGSLDGVTAGKSLPCYDEDHWSANPVIEVGLGIAVGIQRGFSAGPMSAKLTLMLQAILQGTFIEFRRTSESSGTALATTGDSQQQVLYYKVKGVIRFVGELTGSVDLVIINASFTVQVILSASLTIEEYKKSEADLSASVKIKLSVKIGIGIFSFHVHVSFHHTISTSFSFGSKSTPPYLGPNCPGYNESLLAMSAVAAGDAKLDWVAIKPDTDPLELTTYFIPQLTFANDGNASASPYYVNMLYLSYPNNSEGAQISEQDNAFQTFANGVFLWLINAYHGDGTENTASTIEGWSLKQSDLIAINQLLGWSDELFTPDQVNGFTKAFFKLVLTVPDTQGEYGICGFPLPDGLNISSSLAGTMSAINLNEDYLKILTAAQPDAHLNHIGVEGKTSLPASTEAQINQQLIGEFVLTTARQLASAAKLLFTGADESLAVSSMLNSLSDSSTGPSAIDQCAGFLSRFLLHGIRKPDSPAADAKQTPLFDLTGQQFEVSGSDTSLTITLSQSTENPPSWQIEFPASETDLTIDSSKTTLILSPKALESVGHDFKPTVQSAGELSIKQSRNQLYRFNLGGPANWGSSIFTLWQLPNELLKTIADNKGALSLSLHQLSLSTTQASSELPDPLPAITATYKWFTTIKFKLRQIKAGSSASKNPSYLKNAYEFAGTDAADLFKLVSLLGEALGGSDSAPTVKSVNLGYLANDSTSFTALDATGNTPFSLVQTNLSTESRPANSPASLLLFAENDSPSTPLENFLALFWAASVTNNGGYYLQFDVEGQGLPDSLFASQGGTAELCLAMEVVIPAGKPGIYINSFATEDSTGTAEADTEIAFFAECDQIKEVHATIDPGHVGIEVTRDSPPSPPPPSNTPTTDYSASLLNLYTLLTCYVTNVGSYKMPAPDFTSGISPLVPTDSSSADDDNLYYKKIFPVAMPTNDVPSIDAPDLVGIANPYAAVGQSTEFFSSWTDLYGNFLSDTSAELGPIPNGYFDPVPKLAALPNLAYVYSFSTCAGSPCLTVQFLFKQHAYDLLITAVQKAYCEASPLVPQGKWSACTTLSGRIEIIDEQLEIETSADNISTLNDAKQKIFDTQRKLENNAQTYAYFYYQLLPYSSASKQATVEISSSILKSSTSEKGNGQLAYTGIELRENSKAIYEYLLTLYGELGEGKFGPNSTGVSLKPLEIKSGFESDKLVEDYLYVLDLAICIKRNGSFNAEFATVPSVQSTSTSIPAMPDKWDTTPSNPSTSLMTTANNNETETPAYTFTKFASNFALAFTESSMKIGSGVVWDAASNADGKQLWVIRYGTAGLDLSFDPNNIALFSAAPISTQLETKAGISLGETYNPSNGKMDAPSQTLSVSNIDMDASMKSFLAKVEQYLSPEFAVPAAQIPILDDQTKTPFEQLTSAKAIMAEKLKTRITNQLGGSSYGNTPVNERTKAMLAVAEKLEQECLTSLNNYYQIDALVSAELSGSFNLPESANHGTAKTMNVFGNPTISNADDNLSLTSAKASVVQGNTQLAFGIKSHKPKDQAKYQDCQLNFSIGAFEHDMESVSVDKTDYVSGSWLRFLNKTDALPVGSSDVLIPLRAYPNPPSLLAQTFDPTLGSKATGGASINPNETLKQAKEWNFVAQYNHSYTAQDNVYVQFNLNPLGDLIELGVDNTIQLIDALAWFDSNYASMEATLSSIGTAGSSESKIQYTVQSFAQLVALVANATWPVEENTDQRLQAAQQSTYRISEGANLDSGELLHPSLATDKSADFYMKVTAVDKQYTDISTASSDLPTATISGLIAEPVADKPGLYQIFNTDKTPVTLEEAESINARTITLPGINIIDHQVGLSAVRVGRNESLPPNFWYETPFVQFPDHLRPHLDEDTKIPIEGWLPTNDAKTLGNYLSGAIGEILLDSANKFTAQQGGIKIVSYYEYQLQEQLSSDAAQTVSMPVRLAVPIKCTLNPSTDQTLANLIKELGNDLNSWAYTNQPAHLNDTSGDLAQFRFDLSVFSDNSITGQPLMRLRNLVLPTSAIKITSTDS
ncbi:MAG: hypothetical protein COB20_12200 [SAR86 cluster bacterium]|uniref:LysM domain-containing protein n=1 Tax=SAR86 cluster bacterium TaxID=2030880 RepID=A0A2A4X123_9GAMM|nr:MAG: hypothetical protein COB20_12200 [SAR86 cluster bacterium]